MTTIPGKSNCREGEFILTLGSEVQSLVSQVHRSGPKRRQDIMGRAWQREAAQDTVVGKQRDRGQGHRVDAHTSSFQAYSYHAAHSDSDGVKLPQLRYLASKQA